MARAFGYALLVVLSVSGHAQPLKPTVPVRLEQLIESALTSHPSTEAQRELEEAARSALDSAQWQYFPTPSVSIENASTRAADPSYQGSSTVAVVRLQQPLWTGGRLTAVTEKAEAALIASQATLEEVRQQLAIRVLQAYGDWLSARLKNVAHEENLRTHTRLREQVVRRIKEGLSSENDLVLAVGRLESVVADMSVTKTQQEVALSRLQFLVTKSVDDSLLNALVAAPRPWHRGLREILDRALESHPAILKTEAQAKIQAAVIDERQANLSPEVYVRAERQYGNYNYANQPPENRIFVGMNTRFGAGLSTAADIESARAQHRAALADLGAQRLSVLEQVRSDYAQVQSAEAHLAALHASLDSAKKVSASFDRQFLAGRKTWLDVLNAARELTQYELQLADARSSQIVVTWRLAIYSQGVQAILPSKNSTDHRWPSPASSATPTEAHQLEIGR